MAGQYARFLIILKQALETCLSKQCLQLRHYCAERSYEIGFPGNGAGMRNDIINRESDCSSLPTNAVRIIFSEGIKKGLENRIITTALVKYLLSKGINMGVVDGDYFSPNIADIFSSHPQCLPQLFDPGSTNGWRHLADFIKYTCCVVSHYVINIPQKKSIKYKNIDLFFKDLIGMDSCVTVTTLFDIREGYGLLRLLRDSTTKGLIRYSSSKIALFDRCFGDGCLYSTLLSHAHIEPFLSAGGKCIYIPDLNTDTLKNTTQFHNHVIDTNGRIDMEQPHNSMKMEECDEWTSTINTIFEKHIYEEIR